MTQRCWFAVLLGLSLVGCLPNDDSDDDGNGGSNRDVGGGGQDTGGGPDTGGGTNDSGGSGDVDDNPGGWIPGRDLPNAEALRQDCVDQINAFRATLDLPPFERWLDGEDCSDDEVVSDANTGQFHGAFGLCNQFAQNECPGWPPNVDEYLGSCLTSMWNEGPGENFEEHGHYINMSSTDYTQAACGFAVNAQGEWWSVQNFR